MTRAADFLLACSGVDRAILERTPTERDEFINLGAAVAGSAAMAATSGTLALATAIGGGDDVGYWTARVWPGAVLYAAVVFVIDRHLVSTAMNPVRPGRVTNRAADMARTIGAALPRLVIAAILAVLVAEPVLLAVFDHEIDAQLAAQHDAAVTVETDRLTAVADVELARIDARLAILAAPDPALDRARADLVAADTALSAIAATVAELRTQLTAERAGVVIRGSTGRAGDGPVTEALTAEIGFAEIEHGRALDAVQLAAATVERLESENVARAELHAPEMAEVTARRAQIDTGRAIAAESAAETVELASGLLVRVEALEALTAEAGPVATAVWLLRALLLLVDAAPVLFKVQSSLRARRPYDSMLATVENHELANADRMAAAAGDVTRAQARSFPSAPSPQRGVRGLRVDHNGGTIQAFSERNPSGPTPIVELPQGDKPGPGPSSRVAVTTADS